MEEDEMSLKEDRYCLNDEFKTILLRKDNSIQWKKDAQTHVTRYLEYAYRFCMVIILDKGISHDKAEGLSMDIAIKVINYFNNQIANNYFKFEARCSFSTYIGKQVEWKISDYIRKKKLKVERIADDFEEFLPYKNNSHTDFSNIIEDMIKVLMKKKFYVDEDNMNTYKEERLFSDYNSLLFFEELCFNSAETLNDIEPSDPAYAYYLYFAKNMRVQDILNKDFSSLTWYKVSRLIEEGKIKFISGLKIKLGYKNREELVRGCL